MSAGSIEDYLHGVCAVIVEQGLGKARTGILSRQLQSKGGRAQQTLDDSVTHVIVGNNVRLSRIPHLLKIHALPDDVIILRADWLSACFVNGEQTGHAQYIVHPEPSPQPSPIKTNNLSSPVKTELPREAESEVKGSPNVKQESEPSGNVEQLKRHSSPTKPNPSNDTATTSMTSPKAGMFPVTDRRWKVHPGSERCKGRWEDGDSDSDYVYSGDEEEIKKETEDAPKEVVTSEETSSPVKKKRRWICEIPSSEAKSWVNHNKHITDKLEELLTVYKNNGDKWRAMQTTKAVQALKKHPTEVTTFEEARALPFIGDRLADKIFEIISSGRLRRLENVDHEKEAIIKMLKDIHGVGPVVAHQFYAQGYHSLDALRASGVLNRQQTIGVRHYDDFIERMSREEVAEIEQRVKELCDSITPGLKVVTCGSYRRGKQTCGDIDLLITHPDGRSHRGVFDKLLQRAKEAGFFTDDLSVHSDPGGQCKYLGVCHLGEGRKYRRIDIILVPYNEYPLALLHFTGSGHFNRSMRKKADVMGMSLSEHALCTGVIRKKGVKIFDGTPLPVTCEKDVFQYLDMEYSEPTDRDWN